MKFSDLLGEMSKAVESELRMLRVYATAEQQEVEKRATHETQLGRHTLGRKFYGKLLAWYKGDEK